jgi:uncharacterized protein YecE (DUF72 family)
VGSASNQDSDNEPALHSLPIANLHLGTSSWSSEDWAGVFYPEGTAPADLLTEYAKHFNTVEVDSTFYRAPSPSMVKNWAKRTPPGFLFAAKIPRSITHDMVMENCNGKLKEFLGTMDLLGEKRGPLLFQFSYFNKQAFASGDEFLKRLEPFLRRLPSGYAFALEVRNKGWINERFLDVLRKRNVALALIDRPWMTPGDQLMKKLDPITADLAYIRWLGDRKGIEEKTQRWNQVIVNRQREKEMWVPTVDKPLERPVRVYGYFNNHYAGFAPASVALFLEVWGRRHGSR